MVTPQKWLLFVHQLPATPSNLRVRTWRRLQQLGAIPVKQAVYVLPDSAAAREDFEWLRSEVESAGGQAAVFAADGLDAWSEDGLVEEFRRAAGKAYAALRKELDALQRQLTGKSRRRVPVAPAARRRVEQARHRLAAVRATDFFGAPGRAGVESLMADVESRLAVTPARSLATRPAETTASYHGRLWVTRPRPGVDRMASAWLIRRFVDRDARFDFVPDRHRVPPDAVPFDMFGVELTHRGSDCTFEVLCARFAIRDPAVNRLAAVVHDLDLKDDRFGAPDAATVRRLIDGLQLAHEDDHALLEQGIGLFDALYRSFAEQANPVRPRASSPRSRDPARAKSRRRKTR